MEVFASNIDSNATSLHAFGDVVVLYGDSYLSAQEAIYNHDNEVIELFGHIMALKGADFFSLGEYARFDIKSDTRLLEPFYLLDRDTKVWMSTKRAKALKEDYILQSGMVSGCDPNRPLWRIYFSEAKYDASDKWVDIYNARLHFYEIPVFYFPYFGYSLDTSRRSGLLTPGFGVSSAEGFYYEQPVYIAVDDQWDLEIKPQVRTQRGKGIYASLRFVDSNVSFGEVETGYFKEKDEYYDNFELAHKEHYGLRVHYENYRVLQRWLGVDLKGQSALYVDGMWMNDVDYINLQNSDDTKNATSNQLFSRVNLFYNEDKNYFGTYMKYYLDLSKESNNLTIQKIPILHYHRYLQSFFDDHIYYSANFYSNNYTRVEGTRAQRNSLSLPVTFQTSLLDGYLDATYTSQLAGEYINFSGKPQVDINGSNYLDSGIYGRYFHQFALASRLSKGYDGFVHDSSFALIYTKKGGDYTSGYYGDVEEVCSVSGGTDNPLCEFYQISSVTEGFNLEMIQFIIDGSGNQRLYHRLTQNISEDESSERLGELESELEYYISKHLYYYNDTFYNHSRQRVTKLLNTLRYNDKAFTFSVNHLYEDLLRDNSIEYSSYLTTRGEYRYDAHYSYVAAYSFDFENVIKKHLEVGFLYKKRCWNFGLRYVENNRPILTNNASSSVYDKYIYFTVVLQPIGGSEFNYKLSNTLEGS